MNNNERALELNRHPEELAKVAEMIDKESREKLWNLMEEIRIENDNTKD